MLGGAANYLSIGQIYLLDHPLLKAPPSPAHIKPALWAPGARPPGRTFYLHLNRVIKARDLDMSYISGPGHSGPLLVAEHPATAKSTCMSRKARAACGACSSSSAFRAVSQSCRAGNPGLHPRGRRAWLFAVARLWCGVRQSRADCRLRCRRWRGGDRATRDIVAFQQVSRSGHRWHGATGPASQRVQDQ
jgi:hypothetical protein